MPGKYQYDIELKSNVAKLLTDMKEVQDRLDTVEGKEYKIKLNVDEKKLSNVISNLEKMLDSLGKGTGDFKQFENLSKELSSIVSEVQNLSKAFGKVDDSGTKTLLSSIQNIDKSLSELSQHILNVNKNMSNIGSDTNGTVKQVGNIGNAYQNAAKEAEKLADAQSKIEQKTNNLSASNQKKDAFPNADTKLDEAVTSAKDLDKTLEQVDIPTDSFDKVLEKLDRTKSELVDIVKITKQSVSDADGKFHDSYTLKDSRGSTEIYDVNSKTDKGHILRQNIVGYDKKKDELDISKAQLEVDKQLAKEEDNLAKAQQKKAQAFLKEQANYEEDQKKAELIKRQTLAYEELTDTISKYSEVAKRVAGGNAEYGDLELMTKLEDKISQLQKQPILSDSQVSKSEKSLVSLYDQLDKIERKLVETNQKSQDKQIAGFDKRLESYTKKTSGYNATIARFNDGGWTSDAYLKNVQAVKDAVKQYEDLLSDIKAKGGIASEDDIQKLKEYESEIKNTIATVTNMSAAEKGYNFVSGQKELDKIHKLLAENSKMSSEAKAKIKAYYAEIESGNPSMSLDKIHGEILKIYNAEVEAGRAGRTLWDTLKNSGFHQIAAQMAGMIGVYDVINLGKEAISTIVSLDDALVDLKKTTAMNSTQLEEYYYDANDVAKQMGVTTEEIINQSSAWSRLGYNTAETSTEMAKLSSQFASISPGMEVDDAQSGLVSIMKAWSIDPDQVKSEIMDPINQLGNTMAEDNQDIVEGMERSAAALAAVGTSTKDAFALFSGIQEVLQNAEKSGTSLRSVALRLRSFDETTEEYSEDLANITGELIDLTKTAEHAEGVSIFKPGSTTEFKDLTDYFREIAGIWDEMTQKQQNDFLIKAFGRNQAQAGAALIQNFEAVDKALAEMGESAGSSNKEMEAVESSLSYKINALKETWVGCVQDMIDRGDLGTIVTGLTKVSEAITFLLDKLGILGSIGLGAGIFSGIKNVGRDKMYSLSF